MKLTESVIYDYIDRITGMINGLIDFDCESFHDALLLHQATVSLDAASKHLFRILHDIWFPPKSDVK